MLMTNERLRVALDRAGLSAEAVARTAGVDPKTVQRWLSGRTPHRRHRWAVAAELEEDEEYLWPDARRPASANSGAADEVLAAFPHRSELDTRRWWELFERAESHIDLLGYTLYFLPQQHPGLAELLKAKAEAGCQIRIAIADPTSRNVLARDEEEHQAITIVARIESTLQWLEPLQDLGEIEVRFQDAPLYSSIFRLDEQMLVTPHLYATPGHGAPLLHVRRLGPEGLFARFACHFEGIWADSRPIGQDQVERPRR